MKHERLTAADKTEGRSEPAHHQYKLIDLHITSNSIEPRRCLIAKNCSSPAPAAAVNVSVSRCCSSNRVAAFYDCLGTTAD